MVNRHADAPDAPFRGLKQSVSGRKLGRYGLQTYVEPQASFID